MTFDIENFVKINLDTVDSTNLFAKRLVDKGDAVNSFIITKTQTNGQTTKQNSNWFSPVGNMYFTSLIKTPAGSERFFPRLSFISALAVINTFIHFGVDEDLVHIKWPNDILLNIKKVSGILIEKYEDFAIIGVGVNVQNAPPVGMAPYPTTSMLNEGVDISLDDFIIEFSQNLISLVDRFLCGNFNAVIAGVIPFLYKFGEQIFINFAGKDICGKFYGISVDGGIIIETANGAKQTLMSGEMTKENFV